jgi:hypothetical protein
MIPNYTVILKALRLVIAVCAATSSLQAESRTFSIPTYLANPGETLLVPLMLDNAAGLAAIKVQINFDAKVIKLESVDAGPLGQSFEMIQGDGDGFVQLIFFRGDALSSGSGRLAALKFRANAGAVSDLFSELAIADVVLSESTGVIDLLQKDTLTITSGQVTVSMQPNIDNSGSGLPDWWEQTHNLDPFNANSMQDTDQDSLPDLLEYAFGGNPRVADAQQRGVQSRHYLSNGTTFLSAGFFRRQGDTGLIFRVQESVNLRDWYDLPIPQRQIGLPQNVGNGIEYLEVQSTLQITGPEAESKGFMRVLVEKP